MISICTLLFSKHEGNIIQSFGLIIEGKQRNKIDQKRECIPFICSSSQKRLYISIQKLIKLISLTKHSATPPQSMHNTIFNMHICINHVINKRGIYTTLLVQQSIHIIKICQEIQNYMKACFYELRKINIGRSQRTTQSKCDMNNS